MGRFPDRQALQRGFVTAMEQRLRIDARSLAAFRIALGALVLLDLALRSRTLSAFYTDDGVLPRSAYLATAEPTALSLHALSGEAWFQVSLFVLAAVLALALLVGYRTTLATVGSWVLLVSLHNRLPDVLNGGDFLLRLLLFWAIFLPLGVRWAVDSAHAERSRSNVLSVAGVALLVQAMLVYLVNAAMKWHGEAWVSGEGLEYVYSLGQFTVFLGDAIGAYPALLRPLDYLWLATISLAFLLVILTGYRRVAYVALLGSMHLGMLLTMRIDLFPLISIASLLPFLPTRLWEALATRFGQARPVARTRGGLDRLAGWLPRVAITDVPPSLARLKSVALTVVALLFLILILLWNIQFLGFNDLTGVDVAPDEAEWVIELTATDQYWNMFAPDPLSTDGWIVAPGMLENGSRIDAFHGGNVTWDRPPDISDTYPTARWRKYLVGLWRYSSPDRGYFTEYLCERWNRQHETRLQNVSVVFMEQPTRLDEPDPIERNRLASRRC